LKIPMPDIDYLLEKVSEKTRIGDVRGCIDLLEKALASLPREQNPELWAILHQMLAISVACDPLGDPADNIERAILDYEQALEILTREAFPEVWATTQYNLATAYRSRIRGERAENLERAIQHYEKALPRSRPLRPSPRTGREPSTIWQQLIHAASGASVRRT